jgi:hypothetical protein
MKRSFLLKHAETFVESNFYGKELKAAKDIQEVVDGLLWFFEDAGMLPPHRPNTFYDNPNLRTLIGHYENCTWEPEDE